jgi:outer membrane receptor protein involved in Fe transport
VGSTGTDAGASWVRQISRLQLIASGSMRSMRANLDEASVAVTGVESVITRTPPKQIGEGFVLEGRYDVSSRVTIDAGARVEHWTLSRRDTADGTQHFTFVDPRVEAAIRFGDDKDLRVSWLTGFRTPTMNELYRSFRVGSTNTLANNQLQPETSKGPEAAFTIRRERWTARAIAYETMLDGAIFNHTISSSPTAILRQRENGGARTIGSELELEWRAAPALSVTTSWALNDAKMTSGELDGKRVAQVPRAAGSIGLRTSVDHFSASAGIRVIGAQFDDDINQFKLNAGSLADARASWRLSRRAELFGAIENVFDQDIDTGRTPIRTIGSPRISRAGLTVRW